jgi:hypothetical protein
MRIYSGKIVEEIETQILCSIPFVPENHAVNENVEEYDGAIQATDNNTGLFVSPSGISDPCGTEAGMVTSKGSMSTEGETLQVSVLPYRCSICAPVVTVTAVMKFLRPALQRV